MSVAALRRELVVPRPRPHPGQLRVLAEAKRFNVLACGRRWGKTQLGVYLAIEAALGSSDCPPVPVGWFAPSYKLQAEVWRELAWRLSPVAKRINAAEYRIELISGGLIEFWTLANTRDPARGRKYGLVIVDEAAMVKDLETVWNQAIRPTLVDLRGSAWFMSTPKGRNYFYELYTKASEDPENWAAWNFPTASNPFIPDEEIEEARRQMPELAFRQEHLAEFVDFEGAQIRREWLRVGDPPEHQALEVYLGVDLAISTREDADYTAIVALGKEKEGRVWVLDALRFRGTFQEVLANIRNMAARWKPRVIAIEQVQYQAAVVQELLRTTALPVRGVRPDRDKLARALPLIARYEQGLVWHAPDLPREFEEELLSFPVGQHDDQVDALVYAYQASAGGWGLKPEQQRRYAVR